jgi:uncharacterized protein YyaL (SSP411 family)
MAAAWQGLSTRGLRAVMLTGIWACVCGPGSLRGDDPPPAGTERSATAAAHKHPANRLARESSPYLLLHAHNPVDWRPWGPEALEAARQANKPIFLSIGYSSCFWCHVMEREVFENAEIAAYMNANFINIKVDREERPDLDDIYMTALQVYLQAAGSNQGGGWPLSMFLTPEGHPIAGGTYFPPQDIPGRPGFPTVMRTIVQVWTEHEQDVRGTGRRFAAEVQRVMRPALSLTPAPVTRALVDSAVDACLAQYDPDYGGLDFSPDQPERPKFPVPSRLLLLQAQAGRPGAEPQAIAALDRTLDAMASGGIYDHLGGGFHRYSVDRQWRVPHFEKMLYDNAQLAVVYAHAYERTNRQTYRQTASETFDFVLRELTDPAGGFYSALDAQTDGVEGAYYVWSPEEVERVLGADAAETFRAAYGLDQPPFFEHGYVLQHFRPLGATADQLAVSEAELRSDLADMREKLLKVREMRPALLRDDKVLTSWNGLMILALAEGGRALNRPDYTAAAERAALFVAEKLRDDSGRLLRTWRGGEAKLDAYLEDYAYLIAGLLALHESTRQEKWLHAARRLMDDQLDRFWDPQDKGFYFTSHTHEALLARTKDAYDSVLPSGNSVSVRNLVRLSLATGDSRYRDYAADTLRLFAPALHRTPGNLPHMALAVQEYVDAFGEIPAPATAPPAAASPAATLGAPAAASAAPAGLQPWAVQPPDETGKHKAAARVYFAADKLTAGQPTPVAVVVTIADGWHLNANPPQPRFVIPTELSLESKSGTRLDGVRYPAGHEFRVAGINESLLVYEKQVTLLGQLLPPAGSAGTTDELTLVLRYQACNDQTCLQPLRVRLTGTIPIAAPGEAVQTLNESLFASEPRPSTPRPSAPKPSTPEL